MLHILEDDEYNSTKNTTGNTFRVKSRVKYPAEPHPTLVRLPVPPPAQLLSRILRFPLARPAASKEACLS